jgi:hypothetical protein
MNASLNANLFSVGFELQVGSVVWEPAGFFGNFLFNKMRQEAHASA